MQIQIKSKRLSAIIAGIAAVLIVLVGTFAWNSLNQQRINVFRELIVPGVTLHDDFDAPNKDVYVENSGDVRVLVRVRLTEFLQTAERGSLVAGHDRSGNDETDNARLSWAPHSGIGGVTECVHDEYLTHGDNWSAADWFHEYYEWQMGGQKYYMPVKNQLTQDENGDYIDKDGNLVDIGNYICSDNIEYDGTEENVRQTLPADVVTMQSWLDGGKKQGEFWVVDTDGWCYWAQMLEPDTATGLLLDTVTRTGRAFDSDAEYCINVWLQAVDEIDVDLFRINENGGISENGMVLARIVTDTILVTDDGVLYENNRDGTFAQLTDTDGNTLETPKVFIPIGTEAAAAAVSEKVNTPEENRLYIGAKLSLNTLTWDGADFTNYDDLAALPAPWYNLTAAEDGIYTVTGIETGEDNVTYIRIEGGGEAFYLASVLKAQDNLRTITASYTHGYPGTGPYGLVVQGGGKVGTEEDDYYAARYFKQIGVRNGVYIEVANAEGTESIDSPERYYFSDKTNNPRLTFSTKEHDDIAQAVSDAFWLSLAVGEWFDIDYEWGIASYNNYSNRPIYHDIKTDGTMFQLTGVSESGSEMLIGDEFVLQASVSGYSYFKRGENGARIVYNPPEETIVRNRFDLDWISICCKAITTYKDETISVVADFGMGTKPFTPIGDSYGDYFAGTFDGGGHTISGLTVDVGDYAGLFGHIAPQGVVKNLTLTNVNIRGNEQVGGIAGQADNGTDEENINGVVIENCKVMSGTITGKSFVGGIVGANGGFITNCENSADVSASGDNEDKALCGGIAGRNVGTITGCVNKGEILGFGFYIGGIVGRNTTGASLYGLIDGCTNNGDIGMVDNGDPYVRYVGGIAGENVSGCTITNSHNHGDVNAPEKLNIDGIVGSNSGTVDDCTNDGTVTGGS